MRINGLNLTNCLPFLANLSLCTSTTLNIQWFSINRTGIALVCWLVQLNLLQPVKNKRWWKQPRASNLSVLDRSWVLQMFVTNLLCLSQLNGAMTLNITTLSITTPSITIKITRHSIISWRCYLWNERTEYGEMYISIDQDCGGAAPYKWKKVRLDSGEREREGVWVRVLVETKIASISIRRQRGKRYIWKYIWE